MIEYPIIKERIIMNTNQPFYIVYYAKKHKKHITRKGKHDEKSRYGVNKKGEPYYVY